MIVLMDVGNTRFKWATLSQDQFESRGAVPYQRKTLRVKLAAVCALVPTPTRVVVANVAGSSVKKIIRSGIQTQWECEPTFIMATRESKGIINAYPQADKLGVDRWLSMIAAYDIFRGALCVVSCGTCVTADFVSAEGKHLGGYITPGFLLLQQAIIQNVPRCADVAVEFYPREKTLARETPSAIAQGSLLMACAFLKEIRDLANHRLGASARVVLTGGSARMLMPHLESGYDYDPHLVLKGLATQL